MAERNVAPPLASRRARWGRECARVAGAAGLLLYGYAAAGLIGGALPINRGWRVPAAGITIFVASNGVHTDLILPKVAAGVDWRPLLRPGHLRDPRYAGYAYAGFGWGDARFYRETPTWRDVRPATVMAAAFGSDHTLLHVEHGPRPEPARDVRALVLRPDEYRRLAAFVRASFAPGAASFAYGRYDAFYPARGRYSALHTCNDWAGAALRYAGVRVGVWTPFPATVLWWF